MGSVAVEKFVDFPIRPGVEVVDGAIRECRSVRTRPTHVEGEGAFDDLAIVVEAAPNRELACVTR